MAASPATPPAVRDVILMLNGVPALAVIASPFPTIVSKPHPDAVPAVPVALLMSQM